MKIAVVGTGYVGLVSGTCFSEVGHDVICIDIDAQKVKNLQEGIIPIYEPGLEELVKRNIEEERLHFSTEISEGVAHADVIFSAVGTPPDKDHKADLQYVKAVAKSFGEHLKEGDYKIFVNKSTVPVGTASVCEKIIQNVLDKKGVSATFDVCSNPEFLREGAAIKDTMNPTRIVVGTDSEKVKDVMKKLYKPFVRLQSPLIFVSTKSSEIIKYASNSFLATKISFINEIASFCELAGGNVQDIARGMGLDDRIGGKFLHAGIGYGGSCFPKDVQALMQTGKEFGYSFRILDSVEAVNKSQKKKVFTKLLKKIPKLEEKVVTVLGLAFKPKTDDMRDAPSIKIIKKLQAEGAIIQAFDPVAQEVAKTVFSSVNISYHKSPLDALKNADAVLLLTEWDSFRALDLKEIKDIMSGDLFIDGRNVFDEKEMQEAGFEYYSIGR